MPKVFIGSIKKSSKTKHLIQLLRNIPGVKYVKVIYPQAPKMTKGFAIFDLQLKQGMNINNIKKMKLRFKGEFLYIADYLEGEEIKKRDTALGKRKIYISKIPKSTTNKELKLFFTQYGNVETAYVCRERAQKSFLYGFVTFFPKLMH